MRYVAPVGTLLALAALAAVLVGGSLTQPAGPTFEITFSEDICKTPFSGRVYVILSDEHGGEPRATLSFFYGGPFFSREVKDWRPGEPLRFSGENCLGYPQRLATLPAKNYRVQAVMDLNQWAADAINAPGNAYSRAKALSAEDWDDDAMRLEIRYKIADWAPEGSDEVKYISLRSPRISKFYGRDVHLRAAVGLPDSYQADQDRQFPAVYWINGFDGRIRDLNPLGYAMMLNAAGFEAAVIFLEAECPTGHHVFADSANNGPWGAALVEEFIPYLEKQFRLIAEPGARFVTGHSSGGWSSLWLQITYPDMFGGVWSSSPDPVDFTAFMMIDSYDADANFFYNEDGTLRPLSRPGLFGEFFAKDLSERETVLGRGGQLGSFEAVFNPCGRDGKPARLWDRQTGKIDREIAQAWKEYDIRRLIEVRWSTLGPKLEGKLHLFCGGRDDFFLERAFLKLKETLERLGSDAYIEVVPNAGHMLPPSVYSRMARQMCAVHERNYGKEKQER